jgi:hypothetical protein
MGNRLLGGFFYITRQLTTRKKSVEKEFINPKKLIEAKRVIANPISFLDS